MNNKVAKIVTIAKDIVVSAADNGGRFVTIAALVIAIGGVSEAARRHHHPHTARAEAIAICDLDPEYYRAHSQWCDSAEKRHLVTIHHRVRQDFPPVQTFEYATVTRDTQANTEIGPPDRTITLQTAKDVADSGTFGSIRSAVLAWMPGAVVFGQTRIATASPPRPAVRTAAAPAQHPTRVTTNGGPVYITNSRVTVAQQ